MNRIEERSRRDVGPLQPVAGAGEGRFRELIEAAADAVIVVGRDGVIAFVNPAACGLMGRQADDLVGQPFGVPVVPGETTEVDIRRPDGSVRIAEMRTVAAAWWGQRAHLASLRDVTERSRAEEERERHLQVERRRSEQLRRLASISAKVASAHDVASVLETVAEESRNLIGAHRAGVRLSGVPGRVPYESIVSLSDQYRRTPSVGRTSAADGSSSLVAPLVGRGGGELGHVQLSGKIDGAFTDDDAALLGQVAQVAAVAIENARLYEELHDKDRRKDEFLAMLAHELRNPLAAISNAVRVAERFRAEEQTAWAMTVIGRQIRHLTRLIDDLLDVSRITRGKIQLRIEDVDASPILESAVEAVRPLVELRRHEMAVSIGPGLRLAADPTRLEQIVVNLLANAAKYTGDGGHIALTAAREGTEIIITVQDDGVGIPPEAIPRMFDLFAQGDRSLARSEGGLGIGLTLVQKLAEMHGGSVGAVSAGPGRGSEFVVRLPAKPAESPDSSVQAESLQDVPLTTARIMIVDDDQDTAHGMARLLGLMGHEVQIAHDGHSAVESVRSFRPDVVLLDIGLPGMDGFEVAAQLRGDADLEGVVIVAVSGYGQEQDRRRTLEAGFDGHLVKPVDVQALLAFLVRPDAGPKDPSAS